MRAAIERALKTSLKTPEIAETTQQVPLESHAGGSARSAGSARQPALEATPS
jgi:hypothetical protein